MFKKLLLVSAAMALFFTSQANATTLTIPDGESLTSEALDLGGLMNKDGSNVSAAMFFMPAGYEGDSFTIFVSNEAGTFAELKDAEGDQYLITASAGSPLIVDPTAFMGIRKLKIQSTTKTSETTADPQVQTGDAVIEITFR